MTPALLPQATFRLPNTLWSQASPMWKTREENSQSQGYSFKNLLNLPFDDKNVVITDDLAYTLFSDTDIDGMIKAAIAKSTDIYSKTKDVEAKQKTMDLTARFSRQGTLHTISTITTLRCRNWILQMPRQRLK